MYHFKPNITIAKHRARLYAATGVKRIDDDDNDDDGGGDDGDDDDDDEKRGLSDIIVIFFMFRALLIELNRLRKVSLEKESRETTHTQMKSKGTQTGTCLKW